MPIAATVLCAVYEWNLGSVPDGFSRLTSEAGCAAGATFYVADELCFRIFVGSTESSVRRDDRYFLTISAFSFMALPPRSAILPFRVMRLPQYASSSQFIGVSALATR